MPPFLTFGPNLVLPADPRFAALVANSLASNAGFVTSLAKALAKELNMTQYTDLLSADHTAMAAATEAMAAAVTALQNAQASNASLTAQVAALTEQLAAASAPTDAEVSAAGADVSSLSAATTAMNNLLNPPAPPPAESTTDSAANVDSIAGGAGNDTIVDPTAPAPMG